MVDGLKVLGVDVCRSVLSNALSALSEVFTSTQTDQTVRPVSTTAVLPK